MKTNMERWWNDTERVKPKYWERNLSQCRLIHQKYDRHWSGIEPETQRWETGGWPPEQLLP